MKIEVQLDEVRDPIVVSVSGGTPKDDLLFRFAVAGVHMLATYLIRFSGIVLVAFIGSLCIWGVGIVFDSASDMLVPHVEADTNDTYKSALTVVPESELMIMALFDTHSSSTDLRLRKRHSKHSSAFIPGKSVKLPLGAYTIEAHSGPDTVLLFSGDCDSNGNVSLKKNRTTLCMVALSDKMPEGTLVVNTVVVNDDVGEALSSDFIVFANEQQIVSAVPTKIASGNYKLNQFGPEGYEMRVAGDCDASGRVRVPEGGRAECTVYHDDLTPAFGSLSIKALFNDEDHAYADMLVTLNGLKLQSDTATSVPAGIHEVEAFDLYGNRLTLGGDCRIDGTVVVAAGRENECTAASGMVTQIDENQNIEG